MASVIAVGHGSTLTFSGFTAAIRSIGATTQTREVVDASHLGLSDYQRKVMGGLVDPGGFTCEFIFDPADGTNMTSVCIPAITGTSAVSTTITFPKGGNTNGATFSGKTFVSSWDTPELTSDGLMTANVTFSFEGEEGTNKPTFTGATNS